MQLAPFAFSFKRFKRHITALLLTTNGNVVESKIATSMKCNLIPWIYCSQPGAERNVIEGSRDFLGTPEVFRLQVRSNCKIIV